MCAIIGAVIFARKQNDIADANNLLNHIFAASLERGRDGRGWRVTTQYPIGVRGKTERRIKRDNQWGSEVTFFAPGTSSATLIGNMRAEPTTEFVADKELHDQQPYSLGAWSIVHNGTIANDKELRSNVHLTTIDSAAIVEVLHSYTMPSLTRADAFSRMVRNIEGSYAILAAHADDATELYVAANYRPIWYVQTRFGVFFASARNYFPSWATPRMIDPYSSAIFGATGMRRDLTQQRKPNNRALVICSGGLDSVVAACAARADGYDIELLHFQYGSRAEGPEVAAVTAVAKHLDVKLRLFPIPIYKPEDSPLLQADSAIAGGEAGAEFAHEWVPARNLVMLSVATALAEAGGFETLVLGNNLEEAGAYPDNEPEFIDRFNDVLPFAVGDGKRVRVIMPVGNLMKHEIVALGYRLNAPLDKTWSCYRAGDKHCGTCGPCFMRRKAFEINGLNEVIPYACEVV
jgi:7-cyano-7-deazaguanine synthase